MGGVAWREMVAFEICCCWEAYEQECGRLVRHSVLDHDFFSWVVLQCCHTSTLTCLCHPRGFLTESACFGSFPVERPRRFDDLRLPLIMCTCEKKRLLQGLLTVACKLFQFCDSMNVDFPALQTCADTRQCSLEIWKRTCSSPPMRVKSSAPQS